MTLIDTDVILDDALDRYPHSDYSVAFLRQVEQTRKEAFIAWHTVSNVYYLITRERGNEFSRQYILKLIAYVEIAETNTEHLRYAIELEMRDFEDAMQVAAARACGAKHIVTRNIRDFASSPIPAITPQEALTDLL